MTLEIGPSGTAAPPANAPLRAAATELEATFITEMLKHSGFGASRDSFGGGDGEAQFGSFLIQAQAREIARAGGIGLAEIMFASLLEVRDDT